MLQILNQVQYSNELLKSCLFVSSWDNAWACTFCFIFKLDVKDDEQNQKTISCLHLR